MSRRRAMFVPIALLIPLLASPVAAPHRPPVGKAHATVAERFHAAAGEAEDGDVPDAVRVHGISGPAVPVRTRAARFQVESPSLVGGSPAPQVLKNKLGINDPGWAPPDWNNAAGPKRFIEIINNRVAFYNLSLGLLSSAGTGALANSTSTYLSDPVLYFDPASKRFYYTMMDQGASGSWSLDWGYSRTSTPSSVADFCHYTLSTGANLPDFPKIGGTTHFLLIGINNGSGDESQVYYLKKPGSSALSTCPKPPSVQGSATVGVGPVIPVRTIDPATTTYLIQRDWSGGTGVRVVSVTETSAQGLAFGAANVVAAGLPAQPDQAPQPGSAYTINAGGFISNGVQAWDPAYKRNVVWTTVNVRAGAGSAIEWLEIDPARLSVLNSGLISDPTLYLFNGAISPDRVYASATQKGFGSNVVITFNSSSATSYPAMWVASRRMGLGISPAVKVNQATSALQVGCDSSNMNCRWGDYAGASSSVTASLTNATGRVWVTNGTVVSGGYQSVNLQVAP